MDPRKPSPYATFSAYNKIERESVTPNTISRPAQPLPQQPIRENYQNKRQGGGQSVIDNTIPEPSRVRFVDDNVQENPTRFKMVQTSEHLHTVLTKGVENFIASFKNNNRQPPVMRVFLKLYTDWCGPCKKIAPMLDDMSMGPENKDIIFLKFNADLMIKGQCGFSKELQKILKIGAVPAFFGFVNGRMVGSVMGAEPAEIQQLLSKINQLEA